MRNDRDDYQVLRRAADAKAPNWDLETDVQAAKRVREYEERKIIGELAEPGRKHPV